MVRSHSFLEKQTLPQFYQQIFDKQTNSLPISKSQIEAISHEQLQQPEQWYHALALLEHIIPEFDKKETSAFLERIFFRYSTNASTFLSAEDYDWYWNKAIALTNQLADTSAEALFIQADLYLHERRNYIDKQKARECIDKAMKLNAERARIFLGFYICAGILDAKENEDGMEMLTKDIQYEENKQWSTINQAFVALRKDDLDKTKELTLSIKNASVQVQLLCDELDAYLTDRAGQAEEAKKKYEQILASNPSGNSALYLAYLHYNNRIESASTASILELLETALRYNRTPAAADLYYMYFNAQEEWRSEEKAIFFLQKGHEYNNSYCSFRLGQLYLYNDNYQNTEKGLFYLDQAGEGKYADAIALKGYLYSEGELVEKDLPAGIELLNKAIELGSGYAAYRMGVLYEQGATNENGERDYPTALSFYEKSAELGYVDGYEWAGRYHLNGYAGEENLEKALKYYVLGAELGSTFSMIELAIMYEKGTGVEADPEKAFEYAKQAVERGYDYALYYLGYCHERAIGTEENPDEAFRHYQLATERGIIKGIVELACCYEAGYGVEADGKKALEYMLQAAEQDYAYAQYKVGCYYAYGLENVESDSKKAIEWLMKAAEQDYPHALLEIGNYYLYDYDEIGEEEKAFEYYQRAAQQDFVNEGLGLCYDYGYGVEENEAEAFKYYLKAAEDGYTRAKFNVGRCYYFGNGVKENYNEAFRWFCDAADGESTPGLYYKAKMLMNGEGCEQNMEEGITLMKQAAEEDYGAAQFELANYYLVGKGVEANEAIAETWFERAADNGNEQAMKILGRKRKR